MDLFVSFMHRSWAIAGGGTTQSTWVNVNLCKSKCVGKTPFHGLSVEAGLLCMQCCFSHAQSHVNSQVSVSHFYFQIMDL